MIETVGTVREVWGSRLRVETLTQSACAHCSSSECSTGVISRGVDGRRNRIELENTLGAQPGDRVMIGIPEGLLVSASLLAYLAPVLMMIALASLVVFLRLGEVAEALLTCVGLAAGLYAVRYLTRESGVKRRFEPRLLRIIAQIH